MRYFVCLLAMTLMTACPRREPKRVILYPTYGYEVGDHWRIPVRIWVHTPRPRAERLLSRVATKIGRINDRERVNLRHRIQDIVADSRSSQRVRLAFEADPDQEEIPIMGDKPRSNETDLNGIIEGHIEISTSQAEKLLRNQGSEEGRLTLRVISQGHEGSGEVHLIKNSGVSVISDIDDTIKVTQIPQGREVVIRNTFFRDFLAAPGMARTYQSLAESGAAFHYVSGGPWQLYGVLSEFLMGDGAFPAGSFAMKSVPKNLLTPSTWEDLYKLVKDNATFEQKVEQISQLLSTFDGRRFILIGDSGEQDPEVYREIRNRFGDQVEEIRIRDLVRDVENRPQRLHGMTVLDPETGEAHTVVAAD